jgi:hypothetical protein
MDENGNIVEMEIVNVLVSENNFLVLLREKEGMGRVIPISIGAFEANGIVMALEGIFGRRPFTYDIMKAIMDGSGIFIERLVISELRDNIFIGTLYVNDGARVIEYDVRPSDGIAITLRFKSPIFVAEQVFDALQLEESFEGFINSMTTENRKEAKNGDSIFNYDDSMLASGITDSEKLNYLQIQLRRAVEEERYEDAARIRDEIDKLKKNQS